MSELPFGPYSVILADPPWHYSNGRVGDNRRVENHYPTMPLKEILALQLPELTGDAVLFLWAPAAMLTDAIVVMLAWGFHYKSGMVWVKPSIGVGYWARQRHEHLLIGAKRNAHPPEPARRFDSVIDAPRRQHSAKPWAAHDIIEAMYPDARRIELFARERKVGWDVWGNEAPTHPTRML